MTQSSWSRMQTYLTCPRKYELGYLYEGVGLEKIKGVEGRGRMLGSAFHAGVAKYLRVVGLYPPSPASSLAWAVGVANEYLEVNTEQNKVYYDYDAGEYRADNEYYNMIEDLRNLLPKLLTYHLPLIGIGTRYRVATEVELGLAPIDRNQDLHDGLMIEYEISTDDWKGFVDAVLVDLETGEYIAVDWKTRSSFPFDALAAIDGQLPFYAAILNTMGANISKVVMWQFKTKVPKPARINKNGQPSIAAQDTTWETWCGTLPPSINPKQYEDEVRPKLKEAIDFQNPVESIVTDFSSQLAIDQATATVDIIADATRGSVMPARLSSMGCGYCDFWQLCSAPLKYGGDASDIIELEYRSKS